MPVTVSLPNTILDGFYDWVRIYAIRARTVVDSKQITMVAVQRTEHTGFTSIVLQPQAPRSGLPRRILINAQQAGTNLSLHFYAKENGAKAYLDELLSAVRAEWNIAPPTGIPLPKSQQEVQPPEQYVFRRRGEAWEIAYGTGKTFLLPDADGLKYIALLLKQPRRPLGALEMIQLIKGDRSAAGHVPDPEEKEGLEDVDWGDSEAVLDDEARKQYRSRLLELGEERRTANQRGDEKAVLRIDEEEEAIEKALKGATGLFGRKRTVGSSLDKARSTVWKSIDLAKKKIEIHDTELFKHLDSSIKTGGECTYGPDGDVPNWTL